MAAQRVSVGGASLISLFSVFGQTGSYFEDEIFSVGFSGDGFTR